MGTPVSSPSRGGDWNCEYRFNHRAPYIQEGTRKRWYGQEEACGSCGETDSETETHKYIDKERDGDGGGSRGGRASHTRVILGDRHEKSEDKFKDET